MVYERLREVDTDRFVRWPKPIPEVYEQAEAEENAAHGHPSLHGVRGISICDGY